MEIPNMRNNRSNIPGILPKLSSDRTLYVVGVSLLLLAQVLSFVLFNLVSSPWSIIPLTPDNIKIIIEITDIACPCIDAIYFIGGIVLVFNTQSNIVRLFGILAAASYLLYFLSDILFSAHYYRIFPFSVILAISNLLYQTSLISLYFNGYLNSMRKLFLVAIAVDLFRGISSFTQCFLSYGGTYISNCHNWSDALWGYYGIALNIVSFIVFALVYICMLLQYRKPEEYEEYESAISLKDAASGIFTSRAFFVLIIGYAVAFITCFIVFK